MVSTLLRQRLPCIAIKLCANSHAFPPPSELQKLIQSRETLAIQETENKVVKDEFDSIEDEDTPIYKQIGPVLVPQTKAEAEMNVDKRLEFIRAEM